MRIAAISVLATLACGILCGQSFEVASIKPSPRRMPFRMSGGPGTPDPGRFTAQNVDLTNLITMAYGIPYYRLSAPNGLGEARFNLAAKVPDGATIEQFRLMMQNLLKERFQLALHYEKKEMQVYELTVAKHGPKLQESTGDPAPAPPGTRWEQTLGQDGFPVLPSGRFPWTSMIGDKARMRFAGTMAKLAESLSIQLGRPVTDSTGLKGKYDFTLSWVTDGLRADDSGPTLLGACRSSLDSS